jgi:hypothetical protein
MRTGSRQKSFVNATRHVLRLELTLDFADSVSVTAATEVARRVMDSLQVAGLEIRGAQGLQGCSLTCHELRRMVALQVSEAGLGATPGPSSRGGEGPDPT